MSQTFITRNYYPADTTLNVFRNPIVWNEMVTNSQLKTD